MTANTVPGEQSLSRGRIISLGVTTFLICIVVTLLLAEFAIRVFRPQQLWELRPDIWIPAEVFGWDLAPNLDATVNMGVGDVRLYSEEYGHRVGPDGPIEADINVLMLGDSFLAALQVEYEQTFGSLLEAKLARELGEPVRMVNTGVVSWEPNRYLSKLLQMGSDWDAIVVFFYQGNDVVNDQVEKLEPREETKQHDLRWPKSFKKKELIDALAYPVNDFLRENSHLFIFTRHALRYELMRMGLTARTLQSSFSESTKDHRRWDTTAAISANIKKAAGSTPIIFVMLPAVYQVDETVGESYKTYQDKADIDFDQVSRLMNPRLEAEGIVVVDLLQPFRDALKSGYPPTHGSHDTHFNENGHVLTADLVEPYLLELLKNGKAAEPQN